MSQQYHMYADDAQQLASGLTSKHQHKADFVSLDFHQLKINNDKIDKNLCKHAILCNL